MKKILTLSSLILASAVAANAQRVTKIGTGINTPTPDQVLPCNDSFRVDFFFINEGPATLIAGDTLWYYSNGIDSGLVYYRVVTTTRNIGDTVVHYGYNMHVNQLKNYWSITENAIKYAPIPNGTIGFYAAPWATNDDLSRDGNILATYTPVVYNCAATGINDFTKTQLGIYPNPAKNQITVNFDATAAAGTVRVLDVMGRTIITQNVAKNTSAYTLDISTLNNGSYFVELVSGDVRGINKFVVSK